MKTLAYILAFVLLISFAATAQTIEKSKNDTTVISKDTLDFPKFHHPLKFGYRFEMKRPRLTIPENKFFNLNPDPTGKLKLGQPLVAVAPLDRMPILAPAFQSKMPIRRPDPSIYYKMPVKKFNE